MAEAVAETNEEFMEKFFNGEEFTHVESMFTMVFLLRVFKKQMGLAQF